MEGGFTGRGRGSLERASELLEIVLDLGHVGGEVGEIVLKNREGAPGHQGVGADGDQDERDECAEKPQAEGLVAVGHRGCPVSGGLVTQPLPEAATQVIPFGRVKTIVQVPDSESQSS